MLAPPLPNLYFGTALLKFHAKFTFISYALYLPWRIMSHKALFSHTNNQMDRCIDLIHRFALRAYMTNPRPPRSRFSVNRDTKHLAKLAWACPRPLTLSCIPSICRPGGSLMPVALTDIHRLIKLLIPLWRKHDSYRCACITKQSRANKNLWFCAILFIKSHHCT